VGAARLRDRRAAAVELALDPLHRGRKSFPTAQSAGKQARRAVERFNTNP
jgi:hypothetical protein